MRYPYAGALNADCTGCIMQPMMREASQGQSVVDFFMRGWPGSDDTLDLEAGLE